MRKDPTEFRKRFAKWKAGAKPYLYGIPYEDDNHNQNYDLARANQLGYTQDEVGHLPTRDYETGRFLKSTTHPTVSKGVWQDMNVGYDVWYNSEDNSLYSQPNFTSTYKDRLPKYGNGKSPAKRKQSEADVLKALAPSLDPIGDFEIKGNTEPTGEILLAKKPISESQANSKASFSDYLDDAEKTATAELAAIYADPERRKNITAEQFFKLYSKTAGYRTRFDRGMGHKGAFLKYIGGIRNEDPKQVRGYLSPGGYITWNDPATGKRISADAGGRGGVFLNNTIVLGGANVDNFTKAHEWAHWLYNPQRFGEHNPFFMGAGKNFDKPLAPSYFKWALDNDETSNDQLIHNKRWYEGAADINGPVKYELFKKGIFNPGDPDAEITKDQFNTWYNKSPKNRGVERYGIDDTVNFLNNTASIDNQKYDPNKLASAKYGLENFRLPKFGDGTAQDFRYVKDDQGGWNQVTNDEIGRAFQGMVVTPKKTTVKQAPARINNNLPNYRSAYDPNAIRAFTDYLPIVGTAQTAVDVVDSVKQGNYGTAAALGATMIAPSGIGKVAKGLGTVAKQAISAGSTTVGNYISGLAGFKYGREGRRKAVEKVFDADKRIEKTDATTVQRQEPVQPIKRNFIAEAQRKHAAEAVGPDTRSSYQRKQSLAAKQYANQQYLKAKDDAKRAEGLELMMKTVSPSTYVEAATGLDLGTAGRLITDAAAFGFPGAAKSIARSTTQYGRKFLLSQMMRPLNKNMPSVAARFRNQEWSNFLSTTNGDNYYRIAKNARMLNPNEKYFFSHTTPWEEFSGGGSEFPSGAKRLYEFPTETFGKLNATTHTGLETPESVVDMGTKHLLYGNTSSGSRGPVRVLSDKNAELLEMNPFINGTLERPRLPNGFYDKNPNYENIYLGNQTTIDGNTVNQALQNATHTVYYPTQGGVQKELHLAPRKTSMPTLISWSDAQKPLSAEQIFPNAQGTGWLQQTADRLGININHYYNNLITPEELNTAVKNSGYETFVSGKTFTEPAYIPSGFPYGLDKAKILMPYEQIRKMPMMAKYANLPEAEFRKVADDLIGSHEFIHWYNKQLTKNIKSGRMKTPKGYLDYELTWNGENLPDGIDPDALGEMLSYMSAGNGTESDARLGQLFNAFDIKKGQFAPQHINLAKKFYRQVFPDNQMSLFLNAIKDKDALVKFANRNAGTLFSTGLGAAVVNKTTNTENEL